MFKVTRAIIVFEHSCFKFHFPPAIQFSRLRMERYFKSVEKKIRWYSSSYFTRGARGEEKKIRADFSRVNSGLLPFGITVIPIPFSGRMNRNDGWQAYQIARLFEILITRITMDDVVISIIMHTHTHIHGSRKAGQCFHRVAYASENSRTARSSMI